MDSTRQKNKLVIMSVICSIFFIVSTNSALAYTSNDAITVLRQMPSGGNAGETIIIEITLNVGTGISDPIKGLFFTDEIPEGLTIETGSYAVTLNLSDLTNIEEEIGASGDIYPGAVPYRLILETPPDFPQNNPLGAGDELSLQYNVTIPIDASIGTVYTFPGYNWVGRIESDPTNGVFGYEDLPFALSVIPNQDIDDDGIPNDSDNCPEVPNGPNGGTCTQGDYNKISKPCMNNIECGTNGFCSMDQEDTDGDGIGDACDFCVCDVNNDGECTPMDALCVFEKYLMICPTTCGNCDDICCDVTKDGQCTPADALCRFEEYLQIHPNCFD